MNDRNTSGAGGLIAEQRREFDDTGLLHLPNAIPEPQVSAMRENLWAELDRKYHFRPDVPDQWPEGQVFGLQQWGGRADSHTPSLNCSRKPRIVLRQGVYRAKGRVDS